MENWDWNAILFSFKGRINRAKFWLAPILVGLVSGLATSLTGWVAGSTKGGTGDPLFWIGLLATFAIAIVNIWIGLAVMVKRLHDRARSGWWVLAFYGSAFVAFGFIQVFPGLGWLGFLIVAAIMIWATVELAFLKGTTGPNEYGPDPLADKSEVTSAPPAL